MKIQDYLKTYKIITDGSFGTYYAEKYQTEEMPEAANTKQKERVLEIHKDYIAAGAKLIIRERLLTDGGEYAKSDFKVSLYGEDSGVDLVSRSVAKGNSHQDYHSVITGSCRCTGHSECDAIIMDDAKISAIPEITANNLEAALIHEAAIGKIAGEQIIKLMTLGLTESEAEAQIVNGFLQSFKKRRAQK